MTSGETPPALDGKRTEKAKDTPAAAITWRRLSFRVMLGAMLAVGSVALYMQYSRDEESDDDPVASFREDTQREYMESLREKMKAPDAPPPPGFMTLPNGPVAGTLFTVTHPTTGKISRAKMIREVGKISFEVNDHRITGALDLLLEHAAKLNIPMDPDTLIGSIRKEGEAVDITLPPIKGKFTVYPIQIVNAIDDALSKQKTPSPTIEVDTDFVMHVRDRIFKWVPGIPKKGPRTFVYRVQYPDQRSVEKMLN